MSTQTMVPFWRSWSAVANLMYYWKYTLNEGATTALKGGLKGRIAGLLASQFDHPAHQVIFEEYRRTIEKAAVHACRLTDQVKTTG